MSATLPPYARSPTPSYASLPRPNVEDTVEYTPRHGRIEHPFGHITKQLRNGVTVIFRDQDPETRADPTYGNNASVCGEVGLDNPRDVLAIIVKLVARANLSSSHAGNTTQKIVDRRLTLWEATSPGRCPSVVAFAVALPSSYQEEGDVYRLPPSFETMCLGTPLIVAKCSYKLTVTIARTRKSFWRTGTKTYHIPIIYRPRTRPARPLLEDPSFLSTVKAAPFEWHQMIVPLPFRKGANIGPISCNFMIPSVKTFCFSRDIPFHVQLCGSAAALREFYGCSAELEKGSRKWQGVVANIRVFLTRQIYVEIFGRESWRSLTIGEGIVRSLPPMGLDELPGETAVDWEGTVRCDDDITCGSFSISHLTVKDFIVFSIVPGNVHTSPLLPIRHAHPIRLVTDSWADQHLLHPQDR